MRDTLYTQALAPTRDIGARLTFTDPRLRFSYIPPTGTMPTSEAPADYLFSDSCDLGDGYLLCAVPADDPTVVYYKYVTDVDWSVLAIGVAIYHMAVEAGRLFVTTSTGYRYADYQAGSGFGAQTVVNDAALASSLVAPVSPTEVFFLRYVTAPGKPFSYGIPYRVVIGGSTTTLPFRVYDNASPAKILDAVRLDGREYLFASEESGKRAIYFQKGTYQWSEKKYVIPIDVIDDVSQFRLSSANVINGKLVVTGALYRSWGVPMHIYTFGPERYSLGRDLFIGTQAITGDGKMHLYNGEAIYLGAGLRYEAPATSLLGYDNADLTYQAEAVGNIRLSTASNQPYSLTLDLQHTLAHPAIRPGSMVKFEAKINGEYSDIGTYSIDAVIHPSDENGQTLSLALRSWAMKELATWESDAPYDYWSQTKMSSNPKDMSKVIRATGQWKEEDGALTTYDLNKDGILYVSEKACHNGAMRAKFKRIAGDFTVRFGVGVNYSIETQGEAAERLGKDTKDIIETDYGQNGLFAIFGKKEHTGGVEGVGLYALNQNVWTKLTSAACTLTDGVDYWVELRFTEGFCTVYYRQGGSGSWTGILNYTIESNDFLPWKAGYQGRGAIFARTETPSTTCRKILGSLMAVDAVTPMPLADTLQIEEEIVSYSGRSNAEFDQSGDLTPVLLEDTYQIWAGGLSFSNRQPPVNFGSAASVKVRQKMDAAVRNAGTPACVRLRLYKIGNPTDAVRISWAGSTLKAKASRIVSAADLPSYDPSRYNDPDYLTWDWIMVPLGKVTAALTDYMVFERTGPTDENNYYCLAAGTYAAGGTCAKADVHNGTSWVVDATRVINGNTYHNFSTKVDIGDGLTRQAAGYYKNYLVRLIPMTQSYSSWETLHWAGIDLPDEWYQVLGYDEASSLSFTLSGTPSQQHARIANLYPTLTLTGRGLKGTAQVDHTDTLAYIYRPGPFIYISAVEYFSSEMDLTLEDMVAEIAGKAGIGTVESPLIYPTSVIPSAVNPRVQRKNVIVKFRRTSLTGTVILEARKDGPSGAGIPITFSGGSTISFPGELVDITCSYLPTNPLLNTDITVSFFDELQFDQDLNPAGYLVYVSVWVDGMYLHTFVTSDTGSGEYFQIKGSGTDPLTVYLSEGCMRIDNFILDEGQKGAALIDQLIGEKRFFYQDHGEGIRLFRTRDEVNADTPYRLAVSHSDADSDVNLATRIRVEGSDVKEVIDEELMVEHGNLFRLVHMNEINSPSDAAYYAGIALDEFGSRYCNQVLSGAADPRVEPNDVIYCEFPEGVKKVIVDSVDFDLNVSETDATFDMSVSGRVPRSEL